VFGWTQMIWLHRQRPGPDRTGPDRFQMDPIALYQQIPIPTPGSASGHRLLQLGFTISDHDITLAPPAELDPDGWDSHLDLLRSGYPGWIFDTRCLCG